MRNQGDLCLRDITDIHEFAQEFKEFHFEIRGQILYCSSIHSALLSSGTIDALPNPPLAVFNVNNTHWVCMLPLSPSVHAHMPILLTKILAD